MNRLRRIYLGVLLTWLAASSGLSFLIDIWLVPQIIVSRAQEIESLVHLQAEALQYNDHRALRDELIRRTVIEDDEKFELLRPAKRDDRAVIETSLQSCRFVTSQTCASRAHAVVFGEPSSEGIARATIAVALQTDHFENVKGHFLWKALVSFVLAAILGFIVWAIRFQELKDQENRSMEARAEEKRMESLANLAAQVAHDIRSPLAALDMIINDLGHVQEDKRLMIRGAVTRIKDIANDLLQKNKKSLIQNGQLSGAAQEARSTQLIPAVLESLMTEKRLQFRSKIGIGIELKMDPSSYGLFSSVNLIEFKRIVSNLINNSVEALGESGKVELVLSGDDSLVRIDVRDNGKGIPSQVLAKLGSRGETHGKEGGSGLGLYHAKTTLEDWNGSLSIESVIDQGTTVRLVLPRALAPHWFVPLLQLIPRSTVVIIDDDSSIHQIWQGRFESLGLTARGIEVRHFSRPQEVEAWVSALSQGSPSCLYLCDYEFLGDTLNGIALIEKLAIQNQSILVSSRYEEVPIREHCKRLGVRLIPKGMAGFVPISIFEPAKEQVLVPALEVECRPDAILIDDDDLVNRSIVTNTPPVDSSEAKIRYDLCLIDDDTLLIHPIWASMAKTQGLRIRLFSGPQDFLSAVATIDRLTPIYIDVSLGPGISGIGFAHEVFKLGFTEINLATGYESDSIQAPPFIRRIVGKDFPGLKE